MTLQILGQRDSRWAHMLLGTATDSTIGNYGCLLTCYAMLAGTDVPTMNELRKQTGGFNGAYSTGYDISAAAPKVKFLSASKDYWDRVPDAAIANIVADIHAGYYYIILVDATPTVPGIGPDDTHFVLATGVSSSGGIIINDPWYGDQRTLSPTYGKDDGTAIYKVYKYQVTDDPKEVGPANTSPKNYIVGGDGGLNVRSAPSINGTIIGGVKSGGVIKVTGISNNWASVTMSVGNIPLTASSISFTQQSAYVYAPLLKEVTTTPLPIPVPVPAAKTRPVIGLNVLYDAGAAWDAYNQGCRLFTVMDNTGLANDLVNKGATVIYRQWWDHAPSLDEAVDKLAASRIDPRVIRVGVNECEHIDGHDHKAHASWDIELAKKLKAQDSRINYAAGTFSMGTPEFNDQAECDAIRAYYAPAFNSGLIWWDYHAYSPTLHHIDNDPDLIWYETRYLQLFSKCGLDFNSPSRIVFTETGVDQMGTGGFKAVGASDYDIKYWCTRFRAIHDPIVVGGCIFQSGNTNGRWDGYNMRGKEATLKEFYV